MEKSIGVETLSQLIVEVNPDAEHWLQEDPNVDLLESNAVDSINILKIISLLETRYNFVFDVADIRVDHFQSLQSLVALLTSKYHFKRLS